MDEQSTASKPAALTNSPPKPKSQQKIELQVAYDTLIKAYDRIHRLQREASQRPLSTREKEKQT